MYTYLKCLFFHRITVHNSRYPKVSNVLYFPTKDPMLGENILFNLTLLMMRLATLLKDLANTNHILAVLIYNRVLHVPLTRSQAPSGLFTWLLVCSSSVFHSRTHLSALCRSLQWSTWTPLKLTHLLVTGSTVDTFWEPIPRIHQCSSQADITISSSKISYSVSHLPFLMTLELTISSATS